MRLRGPSLMVGNWKMNPATREAAVALASAAVAAAAPTAGRVEVAICPPFPWLLPVAEAVAGSAVAVGAQDCHWAGSGAHTGDVSAEMLAPWCRWVILGHSERRRAHGETDEVVARKLTAAGRAGLGAVVCVGESEEDHLAGRAAVVVTTQVRRSLLGWRVDGRGDEQLVVAYEPVWAIGTGRNAEPEGVAPTMDLIREAAAGVGGPHLGNLRVLYGGSVNPANAAGYLSLEACDGCLVGGASLLAGDFSRLVELAAAGPNYH